MTDTKKGNKNKVVTDKSIRQRPIEKAVIRRMLNTPPRPRKPKAKPQTKHRDDAEKL